MTDPASPLNLSASTERAFRSWWIITLAMIAGGLAGWLLNGFTPPVYEATAQFSIGIDFVRTGPITQYDEDVAVNRAGNLFFTREVLEQVVQQASAEGIETNLVDLYKQISIERRFSLWYLRVRDADPAVAERLAAIWLQTGEALLRDSYQHAVQAYLIERYLQAQEACISHAGSGDAALGPCGSAGTLQVQQNLQDALAALVTEKEASRGLFSALTIGPFDLPSVSDYPLRTGRAGAILVGCLLGLAVGAAYLETRSAQPHRKAGEQ